jgi:hypothetical protein
MRVHSDAEPGDSGVALTKICFLSVLREMSRIITA